MRNNLTKTKNITKTTNGAERIISLLEEQGTEYVFGYPGGSVLPLYEALSNSKIKHILCRHEQAATHAAEGYAKVKGKCGVVLVTSGPGFSNTITGLLNAYSDNSPLVVIAGQTENLDNNEFQEVNIRDIVKTFTKNCFDITDEKDIDRIIYKAFKTAQTLPYAPVIITVKNSILNKTVSETHPVRHRREIKVEAPHSCVLKTIQTLKDAKRPLIVVGGGCKNVEREVVEFAQLTHIPVVNTLNGKGVADNLSCGLIGLCANSDLNEYIKESDIVLALGVKFSNRTTDFVSKFLPKSKIISINIHKNTSDNVKPEKELIGELEVILQQMIGTIKAKNILFDIKYDWTEQLEVNDNIKDDGKSLTSEYVINEIYKKSRKYNPIVTTDVGIHQIDAVKIFKTTSARRFLTSGGFGTMGFGLPAAIGAYFASPDSLVLNITGDGSIQMNMQELATVAQYNIPVKIFIMDNSSLGMIEKLQVQKYNHSHQSELINPDFRKLASAYGIHSYKITTREGLKMALDEILKYKKPVLLDIKVDLGV